MRSPNEPGQPETFQMLWDCKFCGTTKLLGIDNRHCPNCGAAQDPAWRYFPAEADMKFINDPKFAGADRICPFCGQPNSAEAKFCKDCGGDLSTAPEAARKQKLVTGLEGASGKSDDVVLNQFMAEQAAIKSGKSAAAAHSMTPAAKRSGLPLVARIVLVVGVIGVLLGGGYLALSNITHPASLTVRDMTWAHKIDVQQLQQQSSSDWRGSVPSDAYSLSCHTADRCHTESETYTCGYEYKDNGNGSGQRVAKTCTRDKQVCVSDQMCSYYVDRWAFEHTLTASGGLNDTPHCPNFSPLRMSGLGAERGTCEQNYNVIFTNGKKDYTYSQPSEQVWRRFQVGQQYDVAINVLDQPKWDSLKLGAPR